MGLSQGTQFQALWQLKKSAIILILSLIAYYLLLDTILMLHVF